MGLCHVFYQGETQTRARHLPVLRTGPAVELFSEARHVNGRHAHTPILYLDDCVASLTPQAQVDVPALAGVLHGVGQEVEDRLFEPITVHGNRWHVVLGLQVSVKLSCPGGIGACGGPSAISARRWFRAIDLPVLFDLGKVQDVVEQSGQPFALAHDGLEVPDSGRPGLPCASTPQTCEWR